MMDNKEFQRIYNDALKSRDFDRLHRICQNRMLELVQRVNIEKLTEYDICALAIIHKNLYEATMDIINKNPKMKKMYGFISRTTSAVSVVMPAEKRGE